MRSDTVADLHICSLSKLGETIGASGARHVASLVNAGMEVPYPLSVPHDRRLFLGFNDIVEKTPGLNAPERHHVAKLIGFVRAWPRESPLVIHCWMGISRSTAGGYIAQCALMPQEDEHTLARALRAASPEATPNIRLVQFADELLGRKGRMVDAIRGIGRGAEVSEGRPFVLPIRENGVRTGAGTTPDL